MDPTAIALLILVSLSVLAGLCLVLLFILYPELRKGPGWLILLQSIAQLLPDLHWLSITAVWANKDHLETLCDIVASFNNFGLALAPAYSAAICISQCRHFNSQETHSFWLYHLVIIPLSAGISLLIYFEGGAGQSAFGTCSLKKGSWTE